VVLINQNREPLIYCSNKRSFTTTKDIPKNSMPTGHDEANRDTVRQYKTDELPVVGIAICEDKKLVDKIFKGAKLHD
jgi:hypothetical protein